MKRTPCTRKKDIGGTLTAHLVLGFENFNVFISQCIIPPPKKKTLRDPHVTYLKLYNVSEPTCHSKGVITIKVQGDSNMTGTDLYVNKPHCAAVVRP